MKYKSIDGKQFSTRREVRDHLIKNGLGKNLKENYIQIPENTADDNSIEPMRKEYNKKLKRFK